MARLLEQNDTNLNEVGLNTNKNGTLGGTYTFSGSVTFTGTVVGAGGSPITSTSANAFAVGPAGNTNPSFNVDASTASAATGLNVKSAAAAAGVAVSVISSGTNENLTVDAKGSGTITLGSVSTGNVVTQSLLSSPKGITSTIPVAGNVAGLTVVQNDTTNSPDAVDITNSTAGIGLSVTQSGTVAATMQAVAITRNSSVTATNSTVKITSSPTTQTNSALEISDSSTSNQQATIYVNASVRTGQVVFYTHNPASNSGIPTVVHAGTQTITGAVTDGYHGALRLTPTYSAATSQTVTRHNYLDVNNVTLSGAGPAVLTDATLVRFNAAAGTHKAVDAATTKTTPSGVDAWIKVNLNGTLAFVPVYLSKTA